MAESIFVTGAGGFIGQGLIRKLASGADRSVTVLTRRPLPGLAPADGKIHEVAGDLTDPETYRAALQGCDTVVHLAAVTGRAAPEDYERVNVAGTRALLEACKAAGVRRFLYVSTIAAGYPDQRYYPYAQTKARAEALVRESGLAFAIIRPTLVLGESSPIWNTLLKIAKLPVVPLPEGARAVSVQPVHVDDVVRGIVLLLASGRFDGETLELGGPRPMPFREFLGLSQQALHGKPGRLVRAPLTPIRGLLALMEPAARPLMPVTAGQLSVFANDSTPAGNWLLTQLQADMPSTEETIASLLQSTPSGTGDGRPAPPPTQAERPLSDQARRVLSEECATFSTYLVGSPPSAYITERYARAAHVHGLAFDEDFSCFDRATVRLARKGALLARCADAYCGLFHRRGVLRRKLIVAAAILEHVAPTSDAFDRVEERHVLLTVLSLAGHGLASALSLLVGAAVLLPAGLVCRVTARSARAGVS